MGEEEDQNKRLMKQRKTKIVSLWRPCIKPTNLKFKLVLTHLKMKLSTIKNHICVSI